MNATAAFIGASAVAWGQSERPAQLPKGSKERAPTAGEAATAKAQLGLNQRPTLAAMSAAYVREILAECRGNKSEAARILGISRKNLYERLERDDLNAERANDPVEAD